jgi:hypothetical protein
MIMVFLRVGRRLPKQKRRRRFGDLRRLVLVKILSQPQVRAYRAKPIKEILAAGCVVHLRTIHEAKVAEPYPPSSLAGAPAGALPRSAAVSKTSRSSFTKPTCWNTPDTAALFNVLRLVLCTQPRSNSIAFGGRRLGEVT